MTKKCIKCGLRKFYYEAEYLDINTLPPITWEDARDTLFAMQDLLKVKGIHIYLTYGTLLGAVREKNFIKGDLDVDCYITDRRAVFDCLQYLEDNGMKLIRAESVVFSFRYEHREGCYIDLYIRRIPFNIWGIYCYKHSNSMCPRKYLQDGEIEFLGRTFKCPKNPEQTLAHWYGESWRTPIAKGNMKNWYTVPSHHYYLVIKKEIKSIIKTCVGWEFWKNFVKKGR